MDTTRNKRCDECTCLRMQWRLAVVEELIKEAGNLICAVHIRIGNYKTIIPIIKLVSLKVLNLHEINSQTDLMMPLTVHKMFNCQWMNIMSDFALSAAIKM